MQQRKMNRASVSCGTTSGGLVDIFGVLEFLLAGRRQEDRGSICRNIGQIFPKFVENYKLTNPGSSTYPKYKKYKEKYTKEPHNQTA